MSVRILQGDCREILQTLPSESVHCCVTSPPYWGLRDYGVSGQIGLESTFTEFVSEMVKVFREVRRVLRPDGTLWLNLGDSYAGGGGFSPNAPSNLAGAKQTTSRGSKPGGIRVWRDGIVPGEGGKDQGRSRNGLCGVAGLKPKDLCGIPWRVAFALQADGWWLRQDIIWSKPNPMPESVTDRCTKAHEYIFLMSKSARYFYDAEAVREPAEYGRREWSNVEAVMAAATTANDKRANHGVRVKSSVTGGDPSAGRNRRSIWEIATSPFPEAHFATFPPALVEPCILAGCPKGGTVLDPFGGAGTTGLVADRLQRDAILIELNPKYAEMARNRITNDAPLLAASS